MATATLYPSQDTYISTGNVLDPQGTSTVMIAANQNPLLVALLQFNLSSIPAGSTINSAVFTLTNETPSGNSGTFDSSNGLNLSRVTSSWAENTTNYNTRPSESAIIYTFNASVYGTKVYPQALSMDITQMVKDWFVGTYANYGLSIRENSSRVSRWLTSNNGNVAYNPTLVVNYTLPNVAPNAPVLGGTDGMIVATKTPTVTWAYSDPDGNAQGSYLVEVISGDYMTSLFSTGWLSGSATSYTIPVGKITTDGQYYLRVRVMDSNGSINQANGNGPDTSFGNKRIVVDTTAPTIASVQGYSYSNAASGTRRVWAYGASDATSGIDKVYCNYTRPEGSVVNSVQCTASGSDYYVDIPLSAQGEYRVDFYCIDKAGNWMANPSSKSAYFFVDSQRANDPNGGSVYDQTTATINWRTFADPTPSSGYKQTMLWLGEWDGTNWVGGTPNKYNGVVVTTNINVLEQSVTGLTPGKRYRYAVAHYDNADNQSAFTWFEFVTKKKIGEYRSGSRILPVYDPNSGVLGSKALRVGTANGVGCFELVSVSDANATPLRIATPQGVRSISK